MKQTINETFKIVNFGRVRAKIPLPDDATEESDENIDVEPYLGKFLIFKFFTILN